MSDITIDEDLLERMVRAVERVRDRLHRAAKALGEAGIPYAVVGGNAVAAWVARVDESAARNTQNVDLVLRRTDLEAAKGALSQVGFLYRHVQGVDMFVDGPDARPRDAVHIVFAGEKVRPEYAVPVPEIEDAQLDKGIRLMTLESLVRMKLTSFRRKDQVHLLDLIGVDLVDGSWLDRLEPVLAARLKELLDDLEG